jgi:hypothetical protein
VSTLAIFEEELPVTLETLISDNISQQVLDLAAISKELNSTVVVNATDYPDYSPVDVLRALATAIEDFNDRNLIDLTVIGVAVRVTD